MNKKKTMFSSTQKLVMCAILTAMVFIMQIVSMNLRFSMFSITLTLMPIVIGAATCGVGAGAWLGFVFGVAVLITGDAAPFWAVNVFGTIVTVLVKGTVAGFCAGLVYKLLEKYNRYLAVLCASIVAPITNTGVFVIGCYLFFMDTITLWATSVGMSNVSTYVMVGLVGTNFLIEMATNLVFCPAIVRLLDINSKTRRKR